MFNFRGRARMKMSDRNSSNFPELDATRDSSSDISSFDRISDALIRIESRLSKLELDKSKQIPSVVTQSLFFGSRSFRQTSQPSCERNIDCSNLGARPKVPSHKHTCEHNFMPNQAYTIYPSYEHNTLTTGNSGYDIQERFNVIKNSVEKIELPPHMKLHDSRTGITREDQPVLNILSKSGRYVDTILKLLSRAQEGEDLDLDPIVSVLLAHIQYLQEEFTACLVKGKIDDSTAQLFRALQKGTSGFTDSCLQNVRVAAELSSVANRYPSGGRYNSFRGGFGRARFTPWEKSRL
ncbi:hypothetical protein DPMN_118673 [Dreissena polymorpha]|uniref:Uncharacterized protein n=1 Tax=Dreissena polymorpha TaxID=45954 RepID=A0A9D4JM44_DREPO|nr:hypothetical protein DPMN_118673 [Dreissena polymorpha]